MRRTVRTNSEWRRAYREKEELLLERGFPEVSPKDFYRDLFPEGSLQVSSDDGSGKGNIVASQLRPDGRGRTRQWIVFDDLEMLDKVIEDKFGLVPPVSFYGKTHTKENAHELFAMAIDIDYVGKQQLKNLLKQFGNGVQLCPTYLVSSGKGVHLYYFLQEPIPMYHNLEKTLSDLKKAFIKRLWNDTSSIVPDDIDLTGVYQGFRCVGSQSKLGPDYPAKAYRLSERRFTLEEIKAAIPGCTVDLTPLYEKPKWPKTIPMEKAKELYPEWHEARIVKGEPPKKGRWVCKKDLYEWWKRKINSDVRSGGRYFSIMALCAYGMKCRIPEKQIRADAYAFLEHLESLTDDEDNHFTKEDVKAALKALSKNKKELSAIASRAWLEEKTKVAIPPSHREKGKRLKREWHLEDCREQKAKMKRRGLAFKNPEGRPSAEQEVREWQQANPGGRKADCIRETGLSKPTVYKWWKA